MIEHKGARRRLPPRLTTVPVGSYYPYEEQGMAELTKEYRAIIRVKLTDELLPSPVVSKEELQQLLIEALRVGDNDSAVVSVAVHDRR